VCCSGVAPSSTTDIPLTTLQHHEPLSDAHTHDSEQPIQREVSYGMKGLRSTWLKVMNMTKHHGEAAPQTMSDGEKTVVSVAQSTLEKPSSSGWKSWLSGGHSRREWLLLGERAFSHPRYAMLIVVALVLCMFERYWFVLAPLSIFFAVEWSLRFWLQKESGFRNRSELLFLFLDGVATISLIATLVMPTEVLEHAFYLRIARLFRGMYMLRMLRIFAFLTYDTFIYSLPFAMLVMGMVAVAVAVDSVALYLGILLLLESICRAYSIFKVLPEGGRRRAELLFVGLDGLSTVALLGLIPEIASYWAVLRVIRFLVMLNPLGNISMAAQRVALLQEVRRETSMLAGMMVAMMIIGSVSVIYLYPDMDINDDGETNAQDYIPFQVVLYVFRLMVDPGAATPEAFSPWLTGLTAILVLSGVFFFALVVSLGSNVMHYMLRELRNSPLSAREHLVFAGWNDQSLAILKRLDALFSRMRQTFASVWIFHEEAIAGSSSVGSWLSVREVEAGSRNLVERFRLSGVQQLILFGKRDDEHLVDTHHLVRNLAVSGTLISEVALSPKMDGMYRQSLGMRVLNSSSVTARMLYQMHHCAWMPELGIRMLDAVSGETGLHTVSWPFEVEKRKGKAHLRVGEERQVVDLWLAGCFSKGVNLLAARREDGSFVLFADLVQGKASGNFVDVVGLGGHTLLWDGLLQEAMRESTSSTDSPYALKQFVWPESWDLSMLFMGWHEGLPAMIEEMALKHHKLTVHLFSTGDVDVLATQLRLLKDAAVRAAEQCNCELKVSVNPWDGIDSEGWVALLRGCKVMMFYPEEREGSSEDSLLELWFHEVARVLTARKEQVKWWTPPKLMVLPRDGDHVADFELAGSHYPLLEVDVGSPDTFHDVFMARQLLTQCRRHLRPEEGLQDEKSYAFIDAMLGDAVLVEDVPTTRLVELSAGMDWLPIYRDALARGWMLMAYVMPEIHEDGSSLFGVLNHAFPQPQDETGSRMHLLAGIPVMEMDVPAQTLTLLFCRRGVLGHASTQDDMAFEEPLVDQLMSDEGIDEAAPEKAVAGSIEEHVDDGDNDDAVEPELEERGMAVQSEVREGEVMNDSVWPQQADKRLLRVLQKQVEGSLELLSESSEDGLMKLTEILDMGVSEEVEEAIMAALTDLQNIDRVSQRMTNVKSCLDDWANHAPEAGRSALWEEEVAKRYVMEEERMVLKGEL